MLCAICSGFHLYDLLLHSSLRCAPDAEGTWNSVEKFYKHQPGVAALKASAYSGCSMCRLLLDTWDMEGGAAVVGGEEEQMFLGLSGYNATLVSLPYLTVKQFLRSGVVRSMGNYEMYAHRGSVPKEFGDLLGREVHSDPSTHACCAVASGWLDECLNHHSSCSRNLQHNGQLPTRVLDVGDRDGSKHPRLFITKGVCGQFAALSYVWGGDSDFVLNEMTMSRFLQGVEIHEFPRTLQDTISVTRSLGLRFLWIDALCIIQDDKNDWAYEASKMREVYKKAVVTIAAGDSTNTYDGYLNKPRPQIPYSSVNWSSSGNDADVHVVIRSAGRSHDAISINSPLKQRGWTLQEALLAPRTLTFGLTQMYWECPTFRKNEAGLSLQPLSSFEDKAFLQGLSARAFAMALRIPVHAELEKGLSLDATLVHEYGKMVHAVSSKIDERKRSPLPRWINPQLSRLLLGERPAPSSSDVSLRVSTGTKSPFDVYDRWYETIREFSKRALKYRTDSFPALSGIAQDFQSVLADAYCAGLWRGDIIRGLTWSRHPFRSLFSDPAKVASTYDDTKIYIAPSWSWAATTGPMLNFKQSVLRNRDDIEYTARCLDLKTTPSTSDPYGQLKDGYVKLSAPLYSVIDPREAAWATLKPSYPALQKNIHHAYTTSQTFADEFAQQHVETNEQYFVAALMVLWNGLGIRQVPCMDFLILESTGRVHNEYRRVGMMRVVKEEKYGAPGRVHELIDQDVAAFNEIAGVKRKRTTFTIV